MQVTLDQLPDSLITVAVFGFLLWFKNYELKTCQNYFNSGVILFFYLIQSIFLSNSIEHQISMYLFIYLFIQITFSHLSNIFPYSVS